MCGLAGLFDPRVDPRRPLQRAQLERMADVIAHRGPDASGVHLDEHVGLSHRRLSIIDLQGGQQPLLSDDQSIAVVYNGEIYNFVELTRELELFGHRFRTHCDTEVIVHAWRQWGERCVERFRGMFAFALWDRSKRLLFLARDRLGVKPMHYAFLKDGTFAFGSELKCFKTLDSFDRQISEPAVEDYFAFGYVPDPRTIYANALKLPPGHWLSFRVGEQGPVLRQYWDVDFEPGLTLRFDEAVDELQHRLAEAVRIRLMSEVPLGAFLSGGVDSGTVVGLMARLSGERVKTCSIGFDEPEFDESAHAKAIAEHHGTDHHERVVRSDDFALARRVVRLYDEPFADSSAVPTFQVCGLARERVTVALSGDGGDETFGGYRRYRLHLMEERLRSMLPLGIRRALFGPLGHHFPKLDGLPRPLRAKTTLMAIARSSVDAYFNTVSLLRDEDRRNLFQPPFRRALAGYDAGEVLRRHACRLPTDDPLRLVQYLDFKTYLPGDINTKVDRASMAHSLEVREPLMDHLLLDWVCRLPSSFKIRGGGSKLILKTAARSLLPPEVLQRPKMGFAVPVAKWFRSRGGAHVVRAVIDGPAVQGGYLDPARIEQMHRLHLSGQRELSAPLWSVFCFDQFLRGEVAADAPAVLREASA